MDDEKLLLEKAKDGDLDAFERLIEGYQRKVYNIAFRMMGSGDDASDLSQEVFIRVFKSIRHFKEESRFSTWLYRITTNVCLDELRKRKNRKVVYIDEELKLDDSDVRREIESDDPQPDAVAERNELVRQVSEAIDRLPENHRMMIMLRDIQGLSYEEIAKISESPEGTVKSRINRARQALKCLLEDRKELLGEYYVK